MFTRKISLQNKELSHKYIPEYDNQHFYKLCHFGALKLFYSELEFLLKCNKYVNIDECLLLYIGAQPGYRLKHLFIKEYFPNVKMLLYDPLKFDITEDENIIIKQGKDGWFDDNKIDEVLKIANNRKILYMSDIRVSDDDAYVKEKLIYEDMIKQQRWAILMGAEFALLKFRLFYYQKDPSEIDFIDNDYYKSIKNKIIFQYDEEKHKLNYSLLYLSGNIYTQIFAGKKSTEARLFVKKIKYHANIDEIAKYVGESKETIGEKYLFRYYSALDYEDKMFYFNLHTRQNPVPSKIKISDYIIGLDDDYTAYTMYYLTIKWMKYRNIELKLDNIIEQIIRTLTFFYRRYTNNLVVCYGKHLVIKNSDRKDDKLAKFKEGLEKKNKRYNDLLPENIKIWNGQIRKLLSLDIDRSIINSYINSHANSNMRYDIINNLFVLKPENKMFDFKKKFKKHY